MTDATPAFESPQFESPSFPDAEHDDELDYEEADELDAGAPASTNRRDGGRAQAVLEHIARAIVDDPDAVTIETTTERGGLRLALHVAPGDMGRIIGKRGRVAQSLRAVVRAAAAKEGTDASVDIVD